MKQVAALPKWIFLTELGAVITLSAPGTFSGAQADTLTMRDPSIKEYRDNDAEYKNEEEAELHLFSDLCGVHHTDLTALKVRDFRRLQRAYTLLVDEPVEESPDWLVMTPEHAVITLTKPSTVCGMQADKITLRSPTIKETRDCTAKYPTDQNASEMMLYSGLCAAQQSELEGLSVKDYVRLQRGYFRLVDEE